MTSTKLRIAMLTIAATTGIVLAGSAGATTFRTCPNGTVVTDSQRCPTKKIKSPIPVNHAQEALGLKGGNAPQQSQAPKPTDSSKKWRDYIFEGVKAPKPRPKP